MPLISLVCVVLIRVLREMRVRAKRVAASCEAFGQQRMKVSITGSGK